MASQPLAILWAQYRSLFNFYSRGNTGLLVFALIGSFLWYGVALFGAVLVAMICADPRQASRLLSIGSQGLFLVFLYWQIVPLMLASAGAILHLKRLLVYPVHHSQLFWIEVLLRLTTSVEMVLILGGAIVGLLLNPAAPWWKPLPLLLFLLFNLFLSTGLRELLSRLLGRRYLREVAALLFVLLAALPQIALLASTPASLRRAASRLAFEWWPWDAVARLVWRDPSWSAAAVLLLWLAAAYFFGRRQFERGLRFDAEAARSRPAKAPAVEPWLEWLYRLPARFLPDPLGALTEKELRFLSRAPRFRLVFFMGFTFGLLIWLPIAFRSGAHPGSALTNNYLTFVTVYALMLLGEVSFWNTFGFDRGAVQIYYAVPVRMATVLVAKNLAAAFFVLLEISAVATVCALLRMPISPASVAEAFAVTLVLTPFLMGIGNLSSLYYPRPVDPTASWRSASAGRFQAMLLLVYPLVSLPILLAYLARYAFHSHWAFYGVLAFGAALGALFYWVAMDSAEKAAFDRRDRIVALLAAADGPVSF